MHRNVYEKAVSTMAMNKFMHPRNIYNTPADFAKLSDEFVEFRSVAKTVSFVFYADSFIHFNLYFFFLCVASFQNRREKERFILTSRMRLP